jgi:hypothetical protein
MKLFIYLFIYLFSYLFIFFYLFIYFIFCLTEGMNQILEEFRLFEEQRQVSQNDRDSRNQYALRLWVLDTGQVHNIQRNHNNQYALRLWVLDTGQVHNIQRNHNNQYALRLWVLDTGQVHNIQRNHNNNNRIYLIVVVNIVVVPIIFINIIIVIMWWDMAERLERGALACLRSQVRAQAMAENQLFVLICCWLWKVAICERPLWLPVCCVTRVTQVTHSALSRAFPKGLGRRHTKSPNLFILNFKFFMSVSVRMRWTAIRSPHFSTTGTWTTKFWSTPWLSRLGQLWPCHLFTLTFRGDIFVVNLLKLAFQIVMKCDFARLHSSWKQVLFMIISRILSLSSPSALQENR